MVPEPRAVAPIDTYRPMIDVDLKVPRLLGGVMLGVGLLVPFAANGPVGCVLRATTGIPCPACGMTRAVVATLHGDLSASIGYSPFGIVFVAAAIALLASWKWKRVRVPTWFPWLLAPLAVAMWSFQLWKLGTGRPL